MCWEKPWLFTVLWLSSVVGIARLIVPILRKSPLKLSLKGRDISVFMDIQISSAQQVLTALYHFHSLLSQIWSNTLLQSFSLNFDFYSFWFLICGWRGKAYGFFVIFVSWLVGFVFSCCSQPFSLIMALCIHSKSSGEQCFQPNMTTESMPSFCPIAPLSIWSSLMNRNCTMSVDSRNKTSYSSLKSKFHSFKNRFSGFQML